MKHLDDSKKVLITCVILISVMIAIYLQGEHSYQNCIEQGNAAAQCEILRK